MVSFFLVVHAISFVGQERVSAGMSCMALEDVAAAAGGATGGGDGNGDGDDAGKKRSSGKGSKSKSKSKRGHGGVREEIRQLKEVLGVDDPNKTPQVTRSNHVYTCSREHVLGRF